MPERITYAWCGAFCAAPAHVRAQVSQARQSQYRRIARIPFHLGNELDMAGVAFHAIRFVAWYHYQSHVKNGIPLTASRIASWRLRRSARLSSSAVSAGKRPARTAKRASSTARRTGSSARHSDSVATGAFSP